MNCTLPTADAGVTVAVRVSVVFAAAGELGVAVSVVVVVAWGIPQLAWLSVAGLVVRLVWLAPSMFME